MESIRVFPRRFYIFRPCPGGFRKGQGVAIELYGMARLPVENPFRNTFLIGQVSIRIGVKTVKFRLAVAGIGLKKAQGNHCCRQQNKKQPPGDPQTPAPKRPVDSGKHRGKLRGIAHCLQCLTFGLLRINSQLQQRLKVVGHMIFQFLGHSLPIRWKANHRHSDMAPLFEIFIDHRLSLIHRQSPEQRLLFRKKAATPPLCTQAAPDRPG